MTIALSGPLQSGSAVGVGKYVWRAGFVAIYGAPALSGPLQSGSAVGVGKSSWSIDFVAIYGAPAL